VAAALSGAGSSRAARPSHETASGAPGNVSRIVQVCRGVAITLAATCPADGRV
jgi:hypothetical protein